MMIRIPRMLRALFVDFGRLLIFAITVVLVVVPVAGLIIHGIFVLLDRSRGSKDAKQSKN
jgi:hypothetical protein